MQTKQANETKADVGVPITPSSQETYQASPSARRACTGQYMKE